MQLVQIPRTLEYPSDTISRDPSAAAHVRHARYTRGRIAARDSHPVCKSSVRQRCFPLDFPETSANRKTGDIDRLIFTRSSTPRLTSGFPVESCSSSRSRLTSVRETLSSARRRRATRRRTPRDHYKYSRTVRAGNTDRSLSRSLTPNHAVTKTVQEAR